MRPVADDYFGAKIVDPYRYMENLNDPQVQAWMKAEDDYMRAVLAAIPGRAKLLARITTLNESAPAEVSDVRRLPSGRVFYQKRQSSEEVAKLYMRDGLSGKETLLVDPELVTGANTPINFYYVSQDGRYVAYGVAQRGSANVVHIVDTSTQKETGETIDRSFWALWFVPSAWRADNKTFFYNRLAKPEPGSTAAKREQNSRVYMHTRLAPIPSETCRSSARIYPRLLG